MKKKIASCAVLVYAVATALWIFAQVRKDAWMNVTVAICILFLFYGFIFLVERDANERKRKARLDKSQRSVLNFSASERKPASSVTGHTFSIPVSEIDDGDIDLDDEETLGGAA